MGPLRIPFTEIDKIVLIKSIFADFLLNIHFQIRNPSGSNTMDNCIDWKR